MLCNLSEFLTDPPRTVDIPPTYWYEGISPTTGKPLRLPRSPLAETIARGLMQQLADDPRFEQEGKMYGVLLVELPTGEQQVLKAFSGLLQGQSEVFGWVPPIPGREQVARSEAETLTALETIKQALIDLANLPDRQHLAQLTQEFETQINHLKATHRDRKQQRQHLRQQALASQTGAILQEILDRLEAESQRDGMELRRLKRARDSQLQPLQVQVSAADDRIRQLKQERKTLSRQLQAQMHAAYSVMNFLGHSRSLRELMPGGTMPTGTGDCCAPKLLHYAATQGLRPIALAEFWWGKPSLQGDKQPGEFYGACTDRCQPLMGFLLSGLEKFSERSYATPRELFDHSSHALDLTIVYEDDWLIVVDKPSGLLSVPGRTVDRQDSVLSRLRCYFPEFPDLQTVHRLDQDTSGLLVIARDRDTYRHLSQQFQQRQIHKSYEAVLSDHIPQDSGEIALPLWGDPSQRPHQTVHWQWGKPSLTKFRKLRDDLRADNRLLSRLELFPLTGRTHQLRVHTADRQGLGTPILGDRLYGNPSEIDRSNPTDRLHLHARDLRLQHPQSGKMLTFHSPTPF